MNKDEIYNSTFDYKIVGTNIKKYRKKAKLTQYQLAQLVHLSDKQLSKIENGHYKSHFHNFVEIAEALNISLYDLIGNQNLHAVSSFANLISEKAKNCSVTQKKLISDFVDFVINRGE